MTEHSTTLDTVICSLAVDLFSAWDLAVAPSPPTDGPPEPPLPELTAAIDVNGPGFSTTLYLGCPHKVIDVAHRHKARRAAPDDWLKEVSNQLLGMILRRLRYAKSTLAIGLPRIMHPEMLQKRIDRSQRMRFYPFRTLWGEILLIFDGAFNASGIQASMEPAERTNSMIFF